MNARHPLVEELQKLRAIEKRWIWIWSASLMILGCLLLFGIVCVADYYLRIENVFFRCMLSGFFWLGLLLLATRIVWPVFGFRKSAVDVARQLEKLNPDFGSRISLAADFLTSGRPGNGSKRLRQDVISMAERQLSGRNLANQIRTDWPIRICVSLAIVACFYLVLVISRPLEFRIALQRTANPFQENPWPTFNDLEFKDLPEKVAFQDALELTVVDLNRRLPRSVFVEIRDASGIRRREMKRFGDEMKYRLDVVTGSMSLRVRGGDDVSDWFEIAVLHPPEVNEITVELDPPEYTGLKRATIPIYQKIWAGSRIRINGNATMPFSSAELVFSISDQGSDKTGIGLVKNGSDQNGQQRWHGRIVKQRFVFPGEQSFQFTESRDFQIELMDENGLVGGKNRVFRIPVREDEPPVVETTIQFQQSIYSPASVVEVEVRASDDMRLDRADVVVSINDVEFRKWTFDSAAQKSQPAHETNRPEETWNTRLDFKEFGSLKAGDQITFQASAWDIRGSRSDARPLVLKIGTEANLKALGVQQRDRIYQKLSTALGFQTDAYNLTTLAEQQLANQGADSIQNRVQKSIDFQRSVDELLFAENGVVSLCDVLLRLDTIDAPDQSELQRVVDQLENTRSSVRWSIDLLGEWKVTAPNTVARREGLAEAAGHQRKIKTVLDQLAGRIDENTKYQAFLSELRSMMRREKAVLDDVVQLQQRLLSSADEENGKTAAARLAQTQKSIADRLGEISWGQLQAAKNLNSKRMGTLSSETKQAQLSARDAAVLLGDIRLGAAIESLQQVIQRIGGLLEQAARNEASPGTQGSSERLQNAQQDFNSLRQQQQDLAKQIQNWDSLTGAERRLIQDRLNDQRDRLDRFLKNHTDLLSSTAKELLRKTEGLLDQLASDLANGDVESAKTKAGVVDSNLEKVASELAAAANELKRQQRTEAYRRLQIEFQRWLEVEKKIHADLLVLKEQSLETAEFRRTISGISDRQAELQSEFQKANEKAVDFFAVQMQLKEMLDLGRQLNSVFSEITGKLDDGIFDIGDLSPSVSLVDELLVRLAILADEKIETEQPAEQPKNNSSDSKEQTTRAETVQISEFEVQLLRLVQEEILSETERLRISLSRTRSPSEKAQLQEQVNRLADRQSELIATIQKYLKQAGGERKNDPSGGVPPVDVPPINLVPDIPEIDCSGPPVQEAEQKQEPSNKQEKKIESLKPFQKQGEDIGEQSDSVRNRLQEVRDRMLRVQEMIIQRKLAIENQDLQKEIIEELKLFVTDKQKKSKKPNANRNKNSTGKKGDGAATGDQKNRPQDQQNPDQKVENEQINQEIMNRINRIWGHLPDRISRDQRSIRTEDFLPKYRELIKDYFKRLAKEPVGR